MNQHHTVVRADYTAGRERQLHRLLPTAPLLRVNAHRRLRGPFTVIGSLLRELVPDMLIADPRLVQRHDFAILAIAPELGSILHNTRETVTSTTAPQQRTRFYPYAWATRMAQSVTDLLIDHFVAEPVVIVVDRVDEADPTDLDALAIMLRRLDPAQIRLVLLVRDIPEALDAAVAAHAEIVAGDDVPATATADAASAYVDGDCTSDEPTLIAAYQALPEADRVALHDARAAVLDQRNELTLRLGALIHHRLHGSDAADGGLRALDAAIEHCVLRGFYDSVLELGPQIAARVSWAEQPERRWLATIKMATALSLMARPDEAMALYDEATAASPDVSIQMQSAYGRSMLYTRYFEPARRDLTQAQAWINNAIALSKATPDAQRRAYNITFHENGLALIALHLGDPEEALRLVTAGLDRLDREVDQADHGQHPSVLRYNRAQVVARLGNVAQAIDDYTAIMATDPHHSDYYFERAALLRRVGRDEEALADYDHLIELALPFAEAHYNRADLRAAHDDLAGALADLDRAIVLSPDLTDAYVNRAALRLEIDDVTGAAADIAAGLVLDPDNPRLLCQRALLASDDEQAEADLLAALGLDPELAGAWANLGVLRYERGDHRDAISCFDRALALDDDPDVRANRALAVDELTVGVSR